jgi:hypothetical protein
MEVMEGICVYVAMRVRRDSMGGRALQGSFEKGW